jgi:hypothetical protein
LHFKINWLALLNRAAVIKKQLNSWLEFSCLVQNPLLELPHLIFVGLNPAVEFMKPFRPKFTDNDLILAKYFKLRPYKYGITIFKIFVHNTL